MGRRCQDIARSFSGAAVKMKITKAVPPHFSPALRQNSFPIRAADPSVESYDPPDTDPTL